ncbi:MAG: hypothetical protein RR053_05370 [Evtepia sp.]
MDDPVRGSITYHKFQLPNGDIVYIDDEEIPLGKMEFFDTPIQPGVPPTEPSAERVGATSEATSTVPQTDDKTPIGLLIGFLTLSLGGAALLSFI